MKINSRLRVATSCVAVILFITACSKSNDSTSQPLKVVVSTFAGNLIAGNANGTGVAASFNRPSGLISNAGGTIFVADAGNNLIRKITSDGVVTTFAGSGVQGDADGSGTDATFSGPQGVALDGSGYLYVAESLGRRIRKISPDGVVTTLAGGAAGTVDGTGTAAGFEAPTGVAVDQLGDVYVADVHKIRKITTAGVVTTFAGSGTSGSANGTGIEASFGQLGGIVIDNSGNFYVTDTGNNTIRKITSDGLVSTLAGSGAAGTTNGTGGSASFTAPISLTGDNQGNIYVGDSAHLIRAISAVGEVSTIAGTGISDSLNGEGSAASFSIPYGLSVGVGKVFVADTFNNMIRVITAE